MMEMDTRFALHLFFRNSTFEQVYFEAVANAFDAGAHQIDLLIRFDGTPQSPDSLEITITDDGEGFTDSRFERFRTLRKPDDRFHKGLGRLVYLSYFREVRVTSAYEDSVRTFTFSHGFTGKSKTRPRKSEDRAGTKLEFRGFTGDRVHSYDDLRPTTLKRRLLEQFLPMLHERRKQKTATRIRIELITNNASKQYEFINDVQELTIEDVPDFQSTKFTDATIDMYEEIELFYSIMNVQDSEPTVLTAASIDGRSVPLNLLKPSALPEKCVAVFLFESKLFDSRSDSARQRLVLPDGVTERQLNAVFRRHVSRLLNEAFPEIEERNQSTATEFENSYPHLIGLFDKTSVGLIDREEAIIGAQEKFWKQQRAVVEAEELDDVGFRRSLELSARSLAEYVLYRSSVITRLERTTAADQESAIHELIVPQRETFDGSDFGASIYRNNVWLLDDKFMTYRTILSDRKMEELIRSIQLEADDITDAARPDISMVFSADPNGSEAVDVVIVELKRRTLDDKDSTYAATQLLKRARKLVDHCPNIQRMWYYGVIEIDEALGRFLRDDHWSQLFSKGKVYFKERRLENESTGEDVLAPTYLLSFETLVSDAGARNHTFLEVLKSGFRRSMKEGQPSEEAES